MLAHRSGLGREERVVRTVLWQPPVPDERQRAGAPGPDEAEFKPTDRDAYVVVDDVDAEQAVLVVTPWPRLDASGRLVFAVPLEETDARRYWDELHDLLWKRDRRRGRRGQDLPHEFVINADAARLLARINQERNTKGQLIRPLRLGDAFRIRSIEGPDPTRWQDILDVTAQARDAARAALYGAIAPKFDQEPRLREEEEGDMLTRTSGRRGPRQPRRGPTAGPAV
jgi:hypothetical protein